MKILFNGYRSSRVKFTSVTFIMSDNYEVDNYSVNWFFVFSNLWSNIYLFLFIWLSGFGLMYLSQKYPIRHLGLTCYETLIEMGVNIFSRGIAQSKIQHLNS